MASYLQEIQKAFSSYKKAHRFIVKHQLYYWMLVPVVLNVLMFFLFISVGWSYASEITNAILGFFNIESWELGSFQFLIDIFQFLLAFLLRLICVLIYFSIVKYLILILLAPLLAYLSERTEELYTGNSFPFKIGEFLKNTFRGILVATRNIFIELGLTILFALTTFIPAIGLLSPLLTFLVESYFFGYSMIDYYCERQKMSISEGTDFINRHMSFTLVNGVIFNSVLMLPSLVAIVPFLLIGILLKYFFILPIIVLSVLPVYSIVASTIGILEIDKAKLNAR